MALVVVLLGGAGCWGRARTEEVAASRQARIDLETSCMVEFSTIDVDREREKRKEKRLLVNRWFLHGWRGNKKTGTMRLDDNVLGG